METNQKNADIPKEFFNKRLSDFIGDGFILFKENFFKIFPVFLLISFIFLIISSILLIDIEIASTQSIDALTNFMVIEDIENMTDEELNAYFDDLMNLMMIALPQLLLSIFLSTFFSIFPQFMAYGLVGGFLYKKYLKQDVDFGEELGKSFKIEIFIIPGIMALLISFSLSLIITIPIMIILYIFWIFAPTMHTIESKSNLKCLSASFRNSRNNFWRIVLVWLIVSIVTGISSFIFSFITDLIPTDVYSAAAYSTPRSAADYIIIILYQLLFGAVDIILSPLLSCFLTTALVFSKTKQVRRESEARYYQSVPRQEEPYPPITPYETSNTIEQLEEKYKVAKSEETVYCPYCGFSMEKNMNYRFCPSCGGKILK